MCHVKRLMFVIGFVLLLSSSGFAQWPWQPFPWPSSPDVGANLEPIGDLQVVDIAVGCGVDYQTVVRVRITVRNNGNATAPQAYVDVFFDLPEAPSVGDLADWPLFIYTSKSLAPGETDVVEFDVPAEFVGWQYTWVDAVVDTISAVAESNENNNVESANLSLYCIF